MTTDFAVRSSFVNKFPLIIACVAGRRKGGRKVKMSARLSPFPPLRTPATQATLITNADKHSNTELQKQRKRKEKKKPDENITDTTV